MSQYDDEAQVEQFKRWWQENWIPLVAGLGLGLGGIFGFQAWQAHKTDVAERASQMYEELKAAAAVGRAEEIRALGDRLLADYAATPYAAQAALLLAHEAAEAGDWQTADQRLAWVVRNSGDEGLKALARLRRARVLWQLGQPDEALKLLGNRSAGEFGSLYAELRGDIQLAQGNPAAARGEYAEALRLGVAPAHREFLQRKLDDLAHVAAAQS